MKNWTIHLDSSVMVESKMAAITCFTDGSISKIVEGPKTVQLYKDSSIHHSEKYNQHNCKRFCKQLRLCRYNQLFNL